MTTSKAEIYNMVEKFNEAQLALAKRLLSSIVDVEVKNNHLNMPNTETISAIKEVEEMKLNPNLYKSYHNVDDMMKELLK